MGIFNVKKCNFVFASYSIFPFKQIFPKKGPIFPKNVGFSGNLWENDCFALVFAVLLQRRRNKTTLKWFGDLETTSDYFIIWILKSWEWCSRASPSLCRVRKVRTDRWWNVTSFSKRWAASMRTSMQLPCWGMRLSANSILAIWWLLRSALLPMSTMVRFIRIFWLRTF